MPNKEWWWRRYKDEIYIGLAALTLLVAAYSAYLQREQTIKPTDTTTQPTGRIGGTSGRSTPIAGAVVSSPIPFLLSSLSPFVLFAILILVYRDYRKVGRTHNDRLIATEAAISLGVVNPKMLNDFATTGVLLREVTNMLDRQLAIEESFKKRLADHGKSVAGLTSDVVLLDKNVDERLAMIDKSLARAIHTSRYVAQVERLIADTREGTQMLQRLERRYPNNQVVKDLFSSSWRPFVGAPISDQATADGFAMVDFLKDHVKRCADFTTHSGETVFDLKTEILRKAIGGAISGIPVSDILQLLEKHEERLIGLLAAYEEGLCR